MWLKYWIFINWRQSISFLLKESSSPRTIYTLWVYKSPQIPSIEFLPRWEVLERPQVNWTLYEFWFDFFTQMAFRMPCHLWANCDALTKSFSFLELEAPFRLSVSPQCLCTWGMHGTCAFFELQVLNSSLVFFLPTRCVYVSMCVCMCVWAWIYVCACIYT